MTTGPLVSQGLDKAELFRAFSEILETSVARTIALEQAIGEAVVANNGATHQTIEQLQGLDLTRQTLVDLALLMRNLSEVKGDFLSASEVSRLGAGLHLQSVKVLLTPCTLQSDASLSKNAAGDLDLF